MASKIDLFWEIFKSVSNQANTLHDALDVIAKADRTKVDSYFTNVIDQQSFTTTDYLRLRRFLVDLFSSHRTLTTSSARITDINTLSNSELDELFRSFGYPYSNLLRGIDENPLELKKRFFLDLVSLYKIKGTPQALVEVLQYNGVPFLDIYEFFIKFDKNGNLVFEGKAVAGSTVNPSTLTIPFADITSFDPHWLYTADQIITLNSINKINLPSKTPYIGIQPTVDVDGPEIRILVRKVQDQYEDYNNGIELPVDAEVTGTGDFHTMLALYLSCIYAFNKIYETGAPASPLHVKTDDPQADSVICYDSTANPTVCYDSPDGNFVCYDGTTEAAADIIEEFNDLTKVVPSSRLNYRERLCELYDEFSREKHRNFLQNRDDAGNILAVLDPVLKDLIDSSINVEEMFLSLSLDLAIWVRNNIGYGFINFAFVLPSLQYYFDRFLKGPVDFFKPYRVRPLVLEVLQARNRLLNSIIIEDCVPPVDIEFLFHDFLTANSIPCCRTLDIDSTSEITYCSDLGEIHKRCQREFVEGMIDFSWKAFWQRNIWYAENDVIVGTAGDGKHYICTAAHLSLDDNKPLIGPTWENYWKEFSEIVCFDTTGLDFYSRETYDCGSFHDVGAVDDIGRNIFIDYEDKLYDCVMGSYDSTANNVHWWTIPDDDSTADIFYQIAGFGNFDEGSIFDCYGGFDLVQIIEQISGLDFCYLLQENTFHILQENDFKIELEGCST